MFYYDQPYSYFQYLNIVHHIISSVMIIDTGLKLLAYGLNRYMGYVWRKLEFTISFLSLADLIFDRFFHWTDYYYFKDVNYPFFIYLRLAFMSRDFRVLLIIQEFKGNEYDKDIRSIPFNESTFFFNALLDEDILVVYVHSYLLCICRVLTLWYHR